LAGQPSHPMIGYEIRRRASTNSELTSVTSIHVHVHTNLGKVGECVVNAVEVRCLRVSALLDAQVGDQVGERIRLDDGHDTDVRVLCKLLLEL
jgi:hypothetical protein